MLITPYSKQSNWNSCDLFLSFFLPFIFSPSQYTPLNCLPKDRKTCTLSPEILSCLSIAQLLYPHPFLLFPSLGIAILSLLPENSSAGLDWIREEQGGVRFIQTPPNPNTPAFRLNKCFYMKIGGHDTTVFPHSSARPRIARATSGLEDIVILTTRSLHHPCILPRWESFFSR